MHAIQLSKGLGWFSVGLGLTQLLAPRRLGHTIGVDESASLMQGMGLREIATGLFILARPSSPAGAWSRVAGDMLDVGLLVSASRQRWNNPVRIAIALSLVAGATALDVYAANRLSQPAY